jgi:hypothetical protein
MNQATASAPASISTPDPRQKKRLIIGVAVWLAGVALCLAMIPFVQASGLATSVKATLSTFLLLGFPKLFLLVAVAIMGKPGFDYLKSLIASHFRRVAPPAEVSPMRYRIGLILLVTVVVLSSLGDYVASDLIALREEHPRLVAMSGDLLLLVSLFLLGGDFWDKLRALFIRDAKAVFPEKKR